MELTIHHAIVHVLDTHIDAPVLSDHPLQWSEDEQEYLTGLIEKAYTSDECKNCTFMTESAFWATLACPPDFVPYSKQVAADFFEQMRQNPSIPSADLLIAHCTLDGRDRLVLLKMNYKAAYSHFYQQVEGGHMNSIIRQRTILPASKADESAVIDLTDGSIRLIEKKYELDGVKGFYFSERILQSTSARPEKAKFQSVKTAATQAVQESYEATKQVEAEVATILCEEAGSGQLEVERVKQRIEEKFPLAAPAFVSGLEEAHLAPEETVEVSPARIKKMERQSIRTTSGIEIKIPTLLLSEANDFVEFINAPDGSISVLVKDVML